MYASIHCMCECLKRNVFSNDSFHVEKDIFSLLLKTFFFLDVCTQKSVFLSLRSNVCFSSQRRFTKRSTSGFVLDYSIFSYCFGVSKRSGRLEELASRISGASVLACCA